MDAKALSEIQARAEAAGEDLVTCPSGVEGHLVLACRGDLGRRPSPPDNNEARELDFYGDDAAFLLSARSDALALLAEVRRLRGGRHRFAPRLASGVAAPAPSLLEEHARQLRERREEAAHHLIRAARALELLDSAWVNFQFQLDGERDCDAGAQAVE